MKESDFLKKSANSGQLEVVDPSENIFDSYAKKSEDGLRAADLLIQNNLFENSIGESYYAIYSSITALLRKVGVKCENHAVSISLLKTLFNEPKLHDIALKAKEARIGSQYYVDASVNKEEAKALQSSAENFVSAIKLIARRLTVEKSGQMRETLRTILNS